MTDRSRLRLRGFIIALAAPLALALAGCAGTADGPSALWKIVSGRCVPHQRDYATPLPCYTVDETLGHAFLKDRVGASQVLLIATARVGGVEDPAVLAPGAPRYWSNAWDGTRLVEALLDKPLPRDRLSLAINAQGHRTQDQLHIHVDCVAADVREALRAHGDAIGDTWAPFPVPLAGQPFNAIRVRTLDAPGASPFELVARRPGARQDMGAESIAVVGATLANGDAAFYVLETRSTGGEAVQDHACAVARQVPGG